MYATVDLLVLARGPEAQGRKLAPGSRLATLAELESAPAAGVDGHAIHMVNRATN